jgi:hypothetical protein
LSETCELLKSGESPRKIYRAVFRGKRTLKRLSLDVTDMAQLAISMKIKQINLAMADMARQHTASEYMLRAEIASAQSASIRYDSWMNGLVLVQGFACKPIVVKIDKFIVSLQTPRGYNQSVEMLPAELQKTYEWYLGIDIAADHRIRAIKVFDRSFRPVTLWHLRDGDLCTGSYKLPTSINSLEEFDKVVDDIAKLITCINSHSLRATPSVDSGLEYEVYSYIGAAERKLAVELGKWSTKRIEMDWKDVTA